MPPIVTHISPDLDAIGSYWLLTKYAAILLPEFTWPEFVNTGNPDPQLLEHAAAVLDTGKVFDPDTLRFDHHQDAALPCATSLVANFLIERGTFPIHLYPVIDLIHAGDTGGEGGRQSAKIGIHAMLGAYKRLPGKSDRDVLEWGCEQLDLLDASLKYRSEAQFKLESCVAYRSDDNLVVGVQGGDASVTSAAHEVYGARIAVFMNEEQLSDGGTTWAVGVQRLGGAEVTTPHVGDLVDTAVGRTRHGDLLDEFARWFRHPAGFFAGRGTRKAPNPTRPGVPLEIICAALDTAWKRGGK